MAFYPSQRHRLSHLILAVLCLPACQAYYCRYFSNTSISVVLTNQGLTAVPLTIPDEAEFILLEYNNILRLSAGDFSRFSLLDCLDIRNNGITDIGDDAFSGLTQLRYLYLGNNRINKINSRTFRGMQNLDALYLDDNRIGEIGEDDFSEITQITGLHLNHNRIKRINSGTFQEMTNLEILMLYSNDISEIDEGAFVGLTRLTTLHLDHNNIRWLTGAMFSKLPNLNYLSLHNNLLHCDCNLRGFANWLGNIYTGSEARLPAACISPEYLRNASVADVHPEGFACKPLRVLNNSGTVTASDQSDAVLPCGVEADPVGERYWVTSLDVKVNKSNPQFSLLPNGSLLITTVGPRHEGLYTCFVSNVAGTADASVVLQVKETNTTLTLILSVTGGIIGFILICILVAVVVARIRSNHQGTHQSNPVYATALPPGNRERISLPPLPCDDVVVGSNYIEIEPETKSGDGGNVGRTRTSLNYAETHPNRPRTSEFTNPTSPQHAPTYLVPSASPAVNIVHTYYTHTDH